MSEYTGPLRVTVWGENVHEKVEAHVAERYPDGMHGAIAAGIQENLPDAVITIVTMDMPEHGLTDELLANTDVLTWWGHAAHGDVDDLIVDRVHRHVLSGMGLLVLHSGHWSKIFGKLMGTTCTLRWRSEHDQELVWTVNPQHPITIGVPNPIVIPEQEMYGEYFDVPTPDELDLHLGLHRRRGVPFGNDLPAGLREDLLLLARRPGLPRLPPQGRPPGDRERRRVGQARARTRPADPQPLRAGRVLRGRALRGPLRPPARGSRGGPRRHRAGRGVSAFRRVGAPGQKVRVIQVGAGGMGQAWLRNDAENDDVELVGIVDLNLDAARAGASVYGDDSIPVHTDLATLIEQVRPDAILDITVPVAHHPVTTDSLFSGLPVLGEKPAAQTVAEALSLAAAAEVTGELFMVSQSRRYNDQLVAFKQQAGLLGDLGSVTTEFAKAPHFGGFREEMDNVLLLDMAIHPFDSVRYLLDRDPVAVYCESYNPSWSWYRGDAAASAVFEFEGGIRYTYAGSWCAPGAETSWNGAWRISGANGSALWDGDTAPASEVPDGDPGALPALPSVGAEIAGSLNLFVSALRSGETPDGEVHGNVMSLAMVEAAIESKDTGARITIDDVLERAYAEALANEKRDDVRTQLESWTSVRAALQGVAVDAR